MDKMSEFNISGLEFRRAKVQDFEEIMDINREVYSNFDYLPTMHFEFAHSPKFHPFVAVYKGKIVAYKCLMLLEKGQVAFHIARRTHPALVNKGIMAKLTDYAKLICNTGSCCQRYTVRNTMSGKMADLLMLPQHTWKGCAYINMNIEDIKPKLKLLYKNTNTELSYFPSLDEIHHVLDNEESVAYLKSVSRYVIVGPWFAYNTNVQNIKEIVKMYPSCVTINKTVIEALTTYNCVRNLDGALRVGFHYTGKPDIQLWKSHTVNCLKQFLNVAKGQRAFRLVFNFPNDLPVDEVKSILKPVFGDVYATESYHMDYAAVLESSKL